MMQELRWLWYLARLAVYHSLSFIRFFTKPGSRVLVPLALAGLAYIERPELHAFVIDQAQTYAPGYQPESVVLDVAAVVLLVLAIVAYVLASRLLAVLLGAFPVMMRPLPPQHRLEAKAKEIKPVAVRVAVPPLPKARPASATAPMKKAARLSEETP